MSIFRKQKKQSVCANQPSTVPAIVDSILESPVMLIVAVLGGSWLMLSAVVDSRFLGSVEVLITPEIGIQLKINGGQPAAESIQPGEDL